MFLRTGQTRWTHEQKYLYFKLKECVSFQRWEPFRPPVIGLSTLVQEAAMVLDLYQSEERESPKHILGELASRLRESIALKGSVVAPDVTCTLSLIQALRSAKTPEAQDMESLTAVLRALGARVAQEAFSHHVLDCLGGVFAEEPVPYSKIDDLVFTLANELLVLGFSERGLTEWLGAHPFHKTSFNGYLDLLHDLVRRPAMKYRCRFTLVPKGPWEPMAFRDSGIELASQALIAPDSCVVTGRTSVSTVPLVSVSLQEGPTASVEVEARDPHRAAELSLERIRDAAALTRVLARGADVEISVKAVVEDTAGARDIDVSQSRTQRGDLANLHKLVLSGRWAHVNPQAAGVVRAAAYWLNVANESPDQIGLIALWTALELFTGAGSTTVINQAVKYVPPFAVMYFMPLMVDCLMSQLQFAGFTAETDPEVAVALDQREYSRKAAFVHFVLENYADIEQRLENHDVPKRRLREFVALMQDGKLLVGRLRGFKEEVEHDLRRAYRYRNWVVHRGMVPSHHLRRTLDRLIFLCRTFTNGILSILQSSPQLTIKDVLEIKRRSYERYLGLCEEGRPADTLEAIIRPRDLFT